MGCIKLGLNWVFLPHIKPLIVDSRTLNIWKVEFEGIFAIKSTWLAQVSIPPYHSLCSCPTWFCCDSNWGDEEEGLLALSWSWRVQDFGIHLIPWFSSSLWTKPVWGCLERIQNSHLPECPPWSPWAKPWSCGRSTNLVQAGRAGDQTHFSPPAWELLPLCPQKETEWGARSSVRKFLSPFALQLQDMWQIWVASARGARGHFMAAIPHMPGTLWQDLLYYFLYLSCESLPHWFPTSFCLPNRKHLDSFCWMKMLPFEEGRRVKYTNGYPENTN